MNLVDGVLLDAKEAQGVLECLDERILKTLSKDRPDIERILDACDRMAEALNEEEDLQALVDMGVDPRMGKSYLEQAKIMFSKKYLLARLHAEFGENYGKLRYFCPPFHTETVGEQILPLGVLLHIAAGNADGLPAFSVIEGLLTGNINILKLPEVDGGLSVNILLRLLKFEPSLAEYIYVFEYSSRDVEAISKLMEAADAVVVWGGDIAVSAIRKLVKPNTKLIEWGHKASFAYVTKNGMSQENLEGLAQHICTTNQLLCSSCQGIFVDTQDMEAVYDFCSRFLPILEEAVERHPYDFGLGIQSQITQQLYHESFEVLYRSSRIFQGRGCSLIAYPDAVLEPSIQFRNCWVKPLPRQELLRSLRKYKNHLQTAGLLCGESEFAGLSDILWKTGIIRVAKGLNMSSSYCGAAHDGEYALRRYTKIVSCE